MKSFTFPELEFLDKQLEAMGGKKRSRSQRFGRIALAALVALATFMTLGWFLRGITLPLLGATAAWYMVKKRGETTTAKDHTRIKVWVILVYFFLVGPWLLPTLRIVTTLALAIGLYVLARNEKAKQRRGAGLARLMSVALILPGLMGGMIPVTAPGTDHDVKVMQFPLPFCLFNCGGGSPPPPPEAPTTCQGILDNHYVTIKGTDTEFGSTVVVWKEGDTNPAFSNGKHPLDIWKQLGCSGLFSPVFDSFLYTRSSTCLSDLNGIGGHGDFGGTGPYAVNGYGVSAECSTAHLVNTFELCKDRHLEWDANRQSCEIEVEVTPNRDAGTTTTSSSTTSTNCEWWNVFCWVNTAATWVATQANSVATTTATAVGVDPTPTPSDSGSGGGGGSGTGGGDGYNPGTPEQTPSAIELCRAAGGNYVGPDGGCYESRVAYEQSICATAWINNKCLTGNDFSVYNCQKAFGAEFTYASPSGMCYKSENDFKAETCVGDGREWTGAKCLTLEETVRNACLTMPDNIFDATSTRCFSLIETGNLCKNSGFVWADKKCYGLQTAQIPHGLETVFLKVTQVQLDAATGRMQNEAKLALQESIETDALIQARIDNETAELRGLLDQMTQQLDLVKDQLETQKILTKQTQQIATFLGEQISNSAYFTGPPPSGAFGAVKNVIGGSTTVNVDFPSGFPTPTSTTGGWLVRVPVKVSFPAVQYEEAVVVYHGTEIHCKLSADGGRSFTDIHSDLNVDASGQSGGTVQFNMKGVVPKNGQNYGLTAVCGVYFDQEFTFANGYTFTVAGFRQSIPLDRTFYQNGNVLSVQAVGANEVHNLGLDGDVEDGNAPSEEPSGSLGGDAAPTYQPGGTAGAANWAAEQGSKVQAAANSMDQRSAMGLSLLVKYWWVIGIAILALGVLLVRKGKLHLHFPRLPFRKAKVEAPVAGASAPQPQASTGVTSSGLGLDDDLLKL